MVAVLMIGRDRSLVGSHQLKQALARRLRKRLFLRGAEGQNRTADTGIFSRFLAISKNPIFSTF